ncbi:WYL domain-containing protein [Paenibacillus glycanilyticus]|uniref:WYL domain-containing protein n=1 Tax=Paenibacillus glycanilyticus TaxID=126569 RepID=UPI00203C270C|nr:WYL domain-containing protein [Paenibacillus glycanilyticus]MCM3628262.1 WYL domain-containing protein [Paenibacillus glycanilyticus]
MEKYIGKIVQLIYINRKRDVSIRDVRVISVKAGRLKAYCFQAQAIRVFNLDGIVDVEITQKKVGA